MSVGEEYVNDKLEELKDEKQVEIDGLEKRIQGIGDRQKELKAQLYERFGTSINLDA
jgi:chaperonin cofactor prefoldin